MNILRSQSVTKYSRKALLYSLYSLESLKRESQKALLNNMLPRHRPAMRAESFMPPHHRPAMRAESFMLPHHRPAMRAESFILLEGIFLVLKT